MKAFIASLLLLGIVFGGSLGEGLYLDHVTKEIEKTVEQISAGEIDRDEGINGVIEQWEKTDQICKYTVNRKYCHAVTLSLYHLSDCIDKQEEADYQSASRNVIEALHDLRESALSLR